MSLTDDQLYRWKIALELKLRKCHGDAFQEFFSDVMAKAYGDDFVRVRPFGALGDSGCDGYLQSNGQVFACYATRQAGQMGVSRNRWFNIAARRQIQDPVSEAELKPAMAANIVMLQVRDVPMTEATKVPGRISQAVAGDMTKDSYTRISPAYFELATAMGNS